MVDAAFELGLEQLELANLRVGDGDRHFASATHLLVLASRLIVKVVSAVVNNLPGRMSVLGGGVHVVDGRGQRVQLGVSEAVSGSGVVGHNGVEAVDVVASVHEDVLVRRDEGGEVSDLDVGVHGAGCEEGNNALRGWYCCRPVEKRSQYGKVFGEDVVVWRVSRCERWRPNDG